VNDLQRQRCGYKQGYTIQKRGFLSILDALLFNRNPLFKGFSLTLCLYFEFMADSWKTLHQLIHSMSPTEKGYFRKFQAGYRVKEAKVYDYLFDLLEGMESPDDDLILKAMKNRCKNLQSTRAYLYQQLLKSLRNYNSKKNMHFNFREQLDTIEILQSKGLHKEAWLLIEKGLLLCKETFTPTYELIFLHYQKNAIQYLEENKKPIIRKQNNTQIIAAANFITGRQHIIEGYALSIQWLNNHFPLYDEQVKITSVELLSQLQEIAAQHEFDFGEKNLLYACMANICRLHGRLDEAVQYQLVTIGLMEQIDLVQLNRESSYVGALLNLGSMYFENKQYDALENLIGKMTALKFQSASANMINTAVTYVLKIHLHSDTEQFETIRQYASEGETFFNENNSIPNITFDFHIRLLAFYIHTKQFDKALSKANFMLNSSYTHSQPSFHIHVRLMNLIIHYKMQHHKLLPSLFRNTYRFMSTYRHTYKTESTILNFLRRTLNSRDKFETNKVLHNLLNQLQPATSEKTEGSFFRSYFDYTTWLRSELKP
jgi:hypothetical protein